MIKRRVTAAVLAFVLTCALAFTGCGKTENDTSSAQNTTSDAASETGDVDVSSEEVTESEPDDEATPSEDAPATDTSSKAQTTTTKPSTSSQSKLEEVKKYTSDNLPKTDMKKFVLRVGTRSKSLLTNGKNEKNPSADQKARWKYIDEIEERFNCTIQPVYYDAGKASEKYTALILSGASNSVPHVILASSWECGNFMAGKLLTSYDKLKYVDLTAPWWNKSVTEASTVNGKTYLAMSELSDMSLNSWAMGYNKKIAKEIGLTDDVMAKLVNEKKWNWDTFSQYCQKALKDLNGDGKYDKNDRWGFAAPRTDFIYAMLETAGVNIVDKSNNKMVYGLNNDKAITAMEKLNTILTPNAQLRYPEENNTAQMAVFGEGKTLFGAYHTASLTDTIRKNGDMGLIPMPLGPGETEYRGLIDHNTACAMIPTCNKELEKTSIILEALAFQAYKALATSAQNKIDLCFDENDTLSANTLKAVYDRATISIHEFNNTTNFIKTTITPVLNACITPQEDISGVVASIKPASQKVIDSFYGQK